MAPCWGRKQLSSAGSSEPPSIPHIPTGRQEQQLQALDPKKKKLKEKPSLENPEPSRKEAGENRDCPGAEQGPADSRERLRVLIYPGHLQQPGTPGKRRRHRRLPEPPWALLLDVLPWEIGICCFQHPEIKARTEPPKPRIPIIAVPGTGQCCFPRDQREKDPIWE